MTLIPRPRLWKYYLMLTVIHTIGRLPLGWRYGIARFVADRLYNHRRWIRENTRSNVRHVLGPAASDAGDMGLRWGGAHDDLRYPYCVC